MNWTCYIFQQTADLRFWQVPKEGGTGGVQVGADLHVRQEGQGWDDDQRCGPGDRGGWLRQYLSSRWDLHSVVQAGLYWETECQSSASQPPLCRSATTHAERVSGEAGNCWPSVSDFSLRRKPSSPTCWASYRNTTTPTWTSPRSVAGRFMFR